VTSGQKTAVSLLITVVIFACFTIAAFAGLFSTIEARFYEPAKITGIRKQLDTVSDSSEIYIKTLLDRFGTGVDSYAGNTFVSSFLSQEPADADVQQRTKITGDLFSETPGLEGIRLVDANGRNMHFSTYTSDILKQTDALRMYKNYNEAKKPSGEAEFPFPAVAASDSLTNNAEKYRIVYDGKNGRLIFSFPFYDSYAVYRGSILFYVDSQDFDRTLIMQNLVSVNDACVLVSDADGKNGGFVLGMPNVGRDVIEEQTLSKWQSNSSGPDKIVSTYSGGDDKNDSGWILISGKENSFIKVSGIYRDSVFMMPQAVQVLLLVSVFITLFLIVFMIFSLKHDDMVVIRDRIKRFQFALVNEYLEKKESVDWNDISKKIAGRRQDISSEITKSLGHRAKKHLDETNALINRSWDEIINALNIQSGNALAGQSAQRSLQDQQEIRRMLEEILQKGSISPQHTALPAVQKKAGNAEVQEKVAESESPEDAESLEEISEAEPAEDAEMLEEVPEAEPAADVESLEEIPEAEPAEEIEPLEEVPEAEPAADVKSLEEVAAAEPAEDAELLEDVPGSESAEGVSVVESAVDADVPEAEPVEEAESLEKVPEAEAAEEIEPLEEIPEADTADVMQGAEPAENAESPEEVSEAGLAVESKSAAEKTEPQKKVSDAGHTEDSGTLHSIPAEAAVDVDEFINSENKKELLSGDSSFMSEPLQFGEPVRKNYYPKEENKAITDFNTVEPPDFSFLNEEKEKLSPENDSIKTDAIPAAVENVSLESFGVENTQFNPENLHETPGFSSAASSVPAETDDNPVFDMEPVMPDFEELDETENDETSLPDSTIAPSDVKPLEDEKETFPFVFTPFGANNDNVYDLQSAPDDAIIKDKNGIFRISPDLAYTDISLDPALKKLVDSVLR
jgi:hypothetical protein